jgi:hypothetical protein
MATLWYEGIDGQEYPLEVGDMYPSDMVELGDQGSTCEICGSDGAFWRDTYDRFGAFVCQACSDKETQVNRYSMELWKHTQEIARIVRYERMGPSDAPLDFDDLISQIDTFRASVLELRDHRCVWTSDDYCGICGADGRA